MRNIGLYGRWRLTRPPVPANSDGTVRIHVGCGDIDSPGFINVDARPLRHVHYVKSDLSDFHEFRDGIVDFIYMSHILEHVRHAQLLNVVCEIHRILKPKGVFRISVPDFDLLNDIYGKNGRDISVIMQPLMGGQDYPDNVHYAVFNRVFLEQLLTAARFSSVRSWDPLACKNHDFTDCATFTLSIGGIAYPVSLNIEAEK